MRRLLGLLLPLALLVAACGDDDDTDAAETTTTTAAEAVADTSTAAGDEEAPTGSDDAPATTETTVATDAPAGEGPGGAGEDDGLGDAVLVADLTPDAEVPGPGAAGARGRFEGEIVDGRLCIDMVVEDLGDVVIGAHIHEGDASTAGPVLIDLGDPTSMGPSSATWEDECTEVGDDVIQRLAAAPDQHYVNVHAPSFPDGAVRGQLSVASVFDRALD